MHICKSDICIIKKKKQMSSFLQKKPDLKLNKKHHRQKTCSVQ